MKIVLIGAGSAQFGLGTLGDIFQSEVLTGSEIALVDINADSLGRVTTAAKDFIEAHKLPFSLLASTERTAVLSGADFVLISIEVGNRFELWDQDWKLPLQYGIRQVYGENGGPGGLFHALRITPPILDICEDIARLCPEAFVFSFSNPMTAITTTVLRKFPGLKFAGLCHEISSLPRYLPRMLGIPMDKLRCRAAGLNHFSVLVEASYTDTGADAYPDIKARAPAFFERELGYSDAWDFVKSTGRIPWQEGVDERKALGLTESAYSWADRGVFKVVLEKFGLLPITTDSHLGEYIPWAYSAADHKGILDFYALYRIALSQVETKIELALRERVVPIMEGILGDSGFEEGAVNVLNEGFIPDLPPFIAVEVPAKVGRQGLEGVAFPDYPKGFCALLRNYTGVYDLTAEAIIKGRRELVVQALLVSPIVGDCTRVEELVDLMLDRQGEWLGYIK